MFIVNGKPQCCNGTSTSVLFTMLQAENFFKDTTYFYIVTISTSLDILYFLLLLLSVHSNWLLYLREQKWVFFSEHCSVWWRILDNMKLCRWLLQWWTYRCYNSLIHLHGDDSYEHPSLCVNIRLMNSRCDYTARCQARLVLCPRRSNC